MQKSDFLEASKEYLDVTGGNISAPCVVYALDGSGYPLQSMQCFPSMGKEGILEVLRKKTGKRYENAIVWVYYGEVVGWECMNFPKSQWLWERQNQYTNLMYREWVCAKTSTEREKAWQ